MKLPLEISFQGVPRSDAIEAAVKRHASKLDEFHGGIMRCRVSVILEEKHKHQGKPFNVRVDVTIPGHELVSSREHDEDVYVALRDAFKDATRMLEDAARVQRGQVKQHEERLAGKVARINRDEQYGFIQGEDDNDYYFSPDNLADVAFEHLEIGTPVHFFAQFAAEGRQAKRISKVQH
jgi:cold shock CspA family protein